MQNKPNFFKGQINANSVFTKDYEDFMLYKSQKTKPIQTQFKPNQTQSPKGQNERKLTYNKGLQKKR